METTIKATVDAGRLLRKVDRVFDASPTTVFGELLQNARRAGATEVTVNLDTVQQLPGHEDSVLVTFADNGKGIEDPQVLLNLAGPGWDEFTEADEDPAGMGFFSLSNFGDVSVYSRDWLVTIAKKAFHGEAPVRVRTPPRPLDTGTRINWWWPDTTLFELGSALADAAKHCGLERVHLSKDEEKSVITPKEYLEGHACVETFTDKGYDIAVWTSSNSTGTTGTPPRVWINFWGTEITTTLPDSCSLLGRLQVSVRVNVWRTGEDDLQLVLPARNAVVHNERLRTLMEDCEHKLYEFTALERFNDHNLPYGGYQQALKHGFDIGEAKISPSFYDENCLVTGDRDEILRRLVILEKPLAYHRYLRRLFEVLREEGVHNYYFMKPQESMVGYSWYDGLRRVKDVQINLDGEAQDTEKLFSDRSDERDDDDIFKFVGEIGVAYAMTDGTFVYGRPEALVAGGQTASEWDSVDCDTEIFLINEAKTDDVVRDDVVCLIRDSLFVHDFGGDSGPLESQESEFFSTARFAVLEVCCSDLEATRWELEQALKRLYAGRDARFSWSVCYSDRHHAPKLVNIRRREDEGHDKIVATIPKNADGTAYRLVSNADVTPERVERYLVWECGHDAGEDGFILDAAGEPVDLDEWEAKMQTQGIDVREDPPAEEGEEA